MKKNNHKMHKWSQTCLGVCSLWVATQQALSVELEEIIVTAQKRTQSLQEVPVTITALSGDRIKEFGFDNAADIQYQTVGLIVSYASTNAIPNFVLRGVGLTDFTAIQSSPIAIHVDDVFYGNSTLLNFSLFDVDRVEVLKGPQGTLYGRNSPGGAVNYFSRKPTEEREAYINVGIGKFTAVNTDGYISGPLSNDLTGRFSFTTLNQSGGPFTHPKHGTVGEEKKFAARGQLLWNPADDLSVHWTVFGGSDNSEGNQYQGYATGGSKCTLVTTGIFDYKAPCYFDANSSIKPLDDDPFTLETGVINRDKIDAYGTMLNVSYSFNNIDITSVTGLNKVDRISQEDADASTLRNVDVGYETKFSQFSEELRISSTGGSALDWTLGAFFTTDKLEAPRTETDLKDLDFGRQNHAYKLKTNSFALFSHNEYAFNEKLSVILGLRYTKETKRFTGGTINTVEGVGPNSQGDFVAAPQPLPNGNYTNRNVTVGGTSRLLFDAAYLDREISFKNTSWRFGVNYKLNNDKMLYASASNGFRSGGFIGDITVPEILRAPYDKEEITAYELGYKAEYLEGALRWNVAAFYYDYKNVIQALTVTGTGQDTLDAFLINENAADAKVKGLETEIKWAISDNLTIDFGILYLDTNTTALETKPFKVAEDLNGKKLPYAPTLSTNGSVRYEYMFNGKYKVVSLLSLTTLSDHFGEATNIASSKLPSYHLLNSSIAVALKEGLDVTFWVDNLTDKLHYVYVNDLSAFNSILRTAGPPRTYGINVSYEF